MTLMKKYMTKKNMTKKKIPAKPRVANEFLHSKILYPNFQFQHPMSTLVVSPVIVVS